MELHSSRGCVVSNMAGYTHRKMADMHSIYGMANCNGRYALECIVRNTLVERCLAAHSMPLYIDDCPKPARFFFCWRKSCQRTPKYSFNNYTSFNPRNPYPPSYRLTHCTRRRRHPYPLQRIQTLESRDYNNRMAFARWFFQESAADRNFEASVLFTDEAALLEGVMSFHNHNPAYVDKWKLACYTSTRYTAKTFRGGWHCKKLFTLSVLSPSKTSRFHLSNILVKDSFRNVQ